MKILLLILVFFLSSGSISTQDDSAIVNNSAKELPRIRTRLAEEDVVYIGQKVTLWVDVLTNTWFTAAPDFGEVRVAQAITLQLSQFATNFTERIEGDTWAVQRREFVIYPQRVGDYHVPSIEVKLTYARPGKAAGKVTLRSSPLTFSARIPPGAEKVDLFVTTPHLTVEETFDREIQNLRVGDSLIRTITMVAEDSVGMLLPTLFFDQIEGIAVYPDPPQVSEQVIRGESIGKRIESVTYLFEKEGKYQLPALNIYWWDIKNKTLRKEEFPVYKFSVAINPDLDAEMLGTLDKKIPTTEEGDQVSEKNGFNFSRVIQLLLALGVIVACGWLLLVPQIKRYFLWRKKRTEVKKELESTNFRRLIKACKCKNPKIVYNLLMAWLDRIYPGPGAATLTWLIEGSDDSRLKNQVNRLKEELFGKTVNGPADLSWSPRKLIKPVSRARNQLMKRKKLGFCPIFRKSLNP